MDFHTIHRSMRLTAQAAMEVLGSLPKHMASQKMKAYRQRKKLVQRENEIKEMRAKLPKLTRADIRRCRIPFHAAIIEELTEQGYVNAASFLKHIFIYQERYRAEHSYDVIIQARKVLIEDRAEMMYLQEHLKTAEAAHYAGSVDGEIDELLKMSYKYAFGPIDWWWLGEQLFAQCLNITEGYHDDDRFRLTVTYYLYGKYLIEQERSLPLGMEFLNVARAYSKDREWTARRISGRVEKYIFVEACTVLYNTLMDQAKAVLMGDPAWALELTLEARERGIDACLPRADVFHLLGQCEMANGQAPLAVGSFMKALLLYKTNSQMEQCCEAMIGLAQAYQEMGDLYQNKEQLEKLLRFAKQEGLKSYIGQAYLYIGQYFLNAGTPESASPYLTNALSIFHEINDVPRREFVKNLGAVSKGQETFQAYVKLIMRCEDPVDEVRRARNLLRLLKWKNARAPFWDEMTESCSERTPLGEEEMEEWEACEAGASGEQWGEGGEESAAVGVEEEEPGEATSAERPLV